MYEALSRASVVIEVIEDVEQYEATLVSTNGVILQPYDTSTTLVGSVLKNKIDVTNKIKDLRWSKWNPTKDNLIECSDWGKDYKGVNIIEIEKDDVDSKSIFVFEAYNDSGDLLCSTSISIVDINDLLVSTNKPASPYVGQLWVDDSKEPATLYVWNGYKWIVSGSVGAIVKNLLKNTSFVYNVDNWDIVGDKKKSYTPYAMDYIGHRFLVLKSETLTDKARGISQTTSDIINVNSEYSFQMIFYSKEDTETFSNNIYINIYSVDKNSEEVLIHSETVSAERNMQRIFTTFKTREDTAQIKVEILGEPNYRYNFSVGELAIYNTWNDYPWTINPADLVVRDSTYTQEELWNILSNNGTVQGIFSEINPVTGQLDYYINASMIAAGKVKAEFMEMYGLKVLRKDTKEVSLYISDNGEITINSPKIVLSSGQTIEEAISNASIEIDSNMIKSTVIELITSDGEVKSNIGSIAEQTAKGFVNTVKDELNGRITVAEQTIDGFNQRIENAEGSVSSAIQTIDSFSQRIEDAEGNASTAIQTVNSFDRRIQDAEGNASSAKQTADGISARVENVETGQESLVELTSKGVYVGSGNAFVDINGNKITVSASDVHIDAENIALEGYTTINGGFGVDLEGNMHAKNGTFEGTISASAIDMSTIKGSVLIAPNIKSDETDNPVFSLTEDGTLTALNAVIKGEMSGTILSGDYFKSANDKFVVLPNGTLECEDANIKGNIKAGSTITGSVVTGGKIIGTVIQNAEKDPTFSVATDGTITGASIKGGTIGIGGSNYDAFTVDNNGNCKITKGSISIGNNFIVGVDGVLTAKGANFTGSINSGSSIIGTNINGGTITGTTIKNASNTFSIDADGNISGGSITIGENFKVTNDGTLTAKNANFTGNINSGSTITGAIIQNSSGSFKVDANGNIKGASISGSSISGGTITGTGIEGGYLHIGENFFVSNKGALIASDADIAGKITANNGKIGGYTIDEHKLTANNVGMCSNSNVEWAFWAGANHGSDAPFHVGHDGSLYATNADISGTITSSTIMSTELIGVTIRNADNTFSVLPSGDITGASVTSVNKSSEGSVIGYASYSPEGMEIYGTNADKPTAYFTTAGSYVDSLKVDELSYYPMVRQANRNDVPSNFYVSDQATGDGSGRDQNNYSDSIQDIIQSIWTDYGQVLCKNITITVKRGSKITDDISIRGFGGWSNLTIKWEYNTQFWGTILVADNTIRVNFIGETDGTNITDSVKTSQSEMRRRARFYTTPGENGINVYNAYFSIQNFVALCNRSSGYDESYFISYNYGARGYVTCIDVNNYKYAIYSGRGSAVGITNCCGDVKYYYYGAGGGHILSGRRVPACSSGQITGDSDGLVIFSCNNTTMMYTSMYKYGSYSYKNSSGSTGSGSDGLVPVSKTKYTKTVTLTNLRTTVSGSGSATSGKSGVTGQGKWGNYKLHTGHATIPDSMLDILGASNCTINNAYLIVTRQNTDHGYSGEVPYPVIKLGSYTQSASGYKIAKGATKTIPLNNNIISELEMGAHSDLQFVGTGASQYMFCSSVKLKVTFTLT